MADRSHPEIASMLSDLTGLEQVQAAKDVAATMESPGWGLIVDLLERLKAQQLDGLVGSRAVREQAEYACKLAEVRGLGMAAEVGQTVLRVGERSLQQLSELERTS